MLHSFLKKYKNKYLNEIKVSENDLRMQEIINGIPSLISYIPTFWCRGTFTQLIWLLIREYFFLKSVLHIDYMIIQTN